jgi:hypothetical protein
LILSVKGERHEYWTDQRHHRSKVMVAVSWVHRIFVLSFERIILVARPYAVGIIPITQGILRHKKDAP